MAGAGKTTCILQRAAYLVDNLISEEVLVLCFQRFVADSIRARMPPHERIHVRTIDALARQVLLQHAPEQSKEVRCLSTHFNNLLASDALSAAELRLCCGDVRCVLVDEAQDLNKLQFELLQRLVSRLSCALVLIGDPNQTIYHFRRASPVYLSTWNGTPFVLSRNFRSCPAIVELGNTIARACLDSEAVLAVPERKDDPVDPLVLVHGEPYRLLAELVAAITELQATGVNPSDICILTPTRGQSEAYPNLGCAQVANYLKVRGTRTARFYGECGQGEAGPVDAYSPRAGCVNIMTVCASKGLEWRYVFLVTPHDKWFNIMPTSLDHSQHVHQVYVAVTRAMDRLTILTSTGCLNRSFSCVAEAPFKVVACGGREALPFKAVLHSSCLFEMPDQTERRRWRRQHVTHMVTSASPETMAFFEEEVLSKTVTHRSRPPVTQPVAGDAAFLGMLCERIFAKAACETRKLSPPSLPIVENWYAGKMVVVPSSLVSCVSKVLRSGSVIMPSGVAPNLQVALRQPDAVPVDRITFSLIQPQLHRVLTAYGTYLNPESITEQCLESLFLVTLAVYAHSTRHFLHLKGCGSEKRHVLACSQVLQNTLHMARAIAGRDDRPLEFSKRLQLHVKVGEVSHIVHGEADIVHDDTAVELKAASSTTLDHALQVYMYARMLRQHPRVARVINVMAGTTTTYCYTEDAEPHQVLLQRLIDDVS